MDQTSNGAPAQETGVIIPPPDLKPTIDLTAKFIRNKGVEFEQTIRSRNQHTSRFDFLDEGHIYHSYYKQFVEHGEDAPALRAREAVSASIAAAAAPAPAAPQQKKKVSRIQTVSEKMIEYMKKVKISPDTTGRSMPQNEYHVRYPEVYPSFDLEVVQLTAQYVARNGREFLNGLTLREKRNPQFDFLQPTHPLFTFFQQMVQAYTLIIIPKPESIVDLERKFGNPKTLLKDIYLRKALREKQLEEEARSAEDNEQERAAMAMIDWSSFVVVHTVDFNDTDDKMLPEPCSSIEEINRMLQARDKAEELARERAQQIRTETEFGDDMDVDMEDDTDDESIDEDVLKKKPEDDEEELEVVSSVSDKKDSLARAVRYQKCPFCQEEIPISEIQQHIHLEMLQPEWREQRQRLEEKKRDSSLSDQKNISEALGRMASHRTDVFDSDAGPTSKSAQPSSGPSWLEIAQRQAAEQEKEKDHRSSQAQPSQRPQQPQLPPPVSGARPPVMPPPPMPPALPPAVPPPPPIPSAMQMVMPVAGPDVLAQQQQQRLQQLSQREAAGTSAVPQPMHRPPPPIEQPPAKRQKTASPAPAPPQPPAAPKGRAGFTEEEWIASHPDPFKIHVHLPNDPARGWNLNGGSLKIEMESVTDTVGDLKKKLSALLNQMPGNKMKVNIIDGPFLNTDNFTLAKYNIEAGAQLKLGIRERGGRRK